MLMTPCGRPIEGIGFAPALKKHGVVTNVDLLAELTISNCDPPSTAWRRLRPGRTAPQIQCTQVDQRRLAQQFQRPDSAGRCLERYPIVWIFPLTRPGHEGAQSQFSRARDRTLGSDAVKLVREKIAIMPKEVDSWESVSISTDFLKSSA